MKKTSIIVVLLFTTKLFGSYDYRSRSIAGQAMSQAESAYRKACDAQSKVENLERKFDQLQKEQQEEKKCIAAAQEVFEKQKHATVDNLKKGMVAFFAAMRECGK